MGGSPPVGLWAELWELCWQPASTMWADCAQLVDELGKFAGQAWGLNFCGQLVSSAVFCSGGEVKPTGPGRKVLGDKLPGNTYCTRMNTESDDFRAQVLRGGVRRPRRTTGSGSNLSARRPGSGRSGPAETLASASTATGAGARAGGEPGPERLNISAAAGGRGHAPVSERWAARGLGNHTRGPAKSRQRRNERLTPKRCWSEPRVDRLGQAGGVRKGPRTTRTAVVLGVVRSISGTAA